MTLVGVDLGGTKLLVLAAPHELRVETGPAWSPRDLVEHLHSFVRDRGIRPEAIAIAVPGLVDTDGRVLSCDGLLAFNGWSAREALDGLGCPIAVVNDVNAALAEELHDATPDTTAAVVMAGTSIGAAFLVHGRPLLGSSGFAGELGYLPIAIDGMTRRLDELAGGAFIAQARGVSNAELIRLAAARDSRTLELIANAGEALGLGLAAVINLLNPSRVAVGGGALELPGYWDAAQVSATRHAIPESRATCALARVRSGHRVVALGAQRIAATLAVR